MHEVVLFWAPKQSSGPLWKTKGGSGLHLGQRKEALKQGALVVKLFSPQPSFHSLTFIRKQALHIFVICSSTVLHTLQATFKKCNINFLKVFYFAHISSRFHIWALFKRNIVFFHSASYPSYQIIQIISRSFLCFYLIHSSKSLSKLWMLFVLCICINCIYAIRGWTYFDRKFGFWISIW